MKYKADAFISHLGCAVATQCSTSAHFSAWEIPNGNTAAPSLSALQITLSQILSAFFLLQNMKVVNLHSYY